MRWRRKRASQRWSPTKQVTLARFSIFQGERLTLNTLTRTDLELPLSWHDLGISTRDLYTSKQASLVVSLDNVSAVDLASTNTTVVWALWTGVTADRPAIGLVEGVKEGVLLLETEPWLMSLVGLHKLGTLMAVVELVWSSIGVPALGDDQDVGSATEWVGEDGNRSEVDIGVVAWSLASRATIKIPLGKILNLEEAVLWDLGESLEIFTDQYFLNYRPASARRSGSELTFDLERTPPVESIQIYLINNELRFSQQRFLQ
jgi:hypothetical protein